MFASICGDMLLTLLLLVVLVLPFVLHIRIESMFAVQSGKVEPEIGGVAEKRGREVTLATGDCWNAQEASHSHLDGHQIPINLDRRLWYVL